MTIHVTLVCAMSLDGYTDDATPQRLMLSNAADFALVDALRARSDAILVGAGTVRADDPRLLVRSARHRRRRTSQGRPSQPIKVCLTRSGELDAEACFFALGESEKLVYCPRTLAQELRRRLGKRATVVAVGTDEVTLPELLEDLSARGIGRLLVEGGSQVATAFLAGGHVDALQVSIAPFFVGQPGAPRFVGPATFPHDQHHRMQLEKLRRVGDMAVLSYRLQRHG